VGHLSKACKQASSKCINCNGDHLATSHDCSKVIKHKMALSLAMTENIPFADALKSVSSSPSSPSSFMDPRLDFHNFPYLPRSFALLTFPSPHFLSPNSFSALSNLSIFLLCPKEPNLLWFLPPSRSSHQTASNPYSNSQLLSFNSISAYPKAHRDLLLEFYGRLPLYLKITVSSSFFFPSFGL